MNATMVVWVLVLLSGDSDRNGFAPTVIDNIAAEHNCRALAHELLATGEYASARCYAVRKVATRNSLDARETAGGSHTDGEGA